MKGRLLVISGLVVLNIVLVGVWYLGFRSESIDLESVDLAGKNFSFEELKAYFTKIGKEKGAGSAFEVLKTANLPPNTDTHLLGHVVGDMLYEQKGAEGIAVCTHDFRNACSHSIVVGLLSDKGENALSDVDKACKKAPGGKGAYGMCYHGLGHGILAYTGYDEEKTVKICKKTPQISQCISGSVMELISGGFHDRELWEKQRKKYLNPDDPFWLCEGDIIPLEAKWQCFSYLTPYLWEAVSANIGNPTEEDHKKAFALCEQADNKYQSVCYGGFGKEFTTLVQERDIRKIDEMNNEQLEKVYSLCALAKAPEGVKACVSQALGSLYWGGENNRETSIRFCSLIPDSGVQKGCFAELITAVRTYIADDSYKKSFCKEMPESYRQECKKILL